ncbi:MAG: hypothetical protein AB1403_22445, partial [Candidatus Riflebacteria bacterium]
MKNNRCFLFALLLFAFLAGNLAAQTEKDALVENTAALKENTQAVKRLTEVLEKGNFGGFQGSAAPAPDLSGAKVQADLQQMLAGLKWETNEEYMGMGSKEAK